MQDASILCHSHLECAHVKLQPILHNWVTLQRVKVIWYMPCLHFVLLQFSTVMLPDTAVCQQLCSPIVMTAHIQRQQLH